ncbi:MAG TPA: addiction module protein [Fimbriiglobus sp.]|jgi:putative addiction module component (TIGR02574 family)|nr:addiction module protein [Fimbriiglobus sp.]
MSTIHEIEQAIRKLEPADLAAFRAWFAAFDADAWDKQLDDDVAAGRLDRLAEEALTLSQSERLELAGALLAASDPTPPEPTGDAWVDELRRRSAQIDTGEATLSPWPEVKRRVRDRVEGRADG